MVSSSSTRIELLACFVVGVIARQLDTQRRIHWVKDFANAMLDVLYIAVAVLVFNAVGPDPHNPLRCAASSRSQLRWRWRGGSSIRSR